MTRLGPRLGLRQRVSGLFGMGALLIALFVAVTTYTAAANYLWAQRESTTLRQASFNARAVDGALSTERPALDDLMERVDSAEQTSSPLVHWAGRWYDDRFSPGVAALPREFVTAAEQRRPVLQRVELESGMAVVIAIPVDDGSYVEVFPLIELDDTLNTLGVTLAATTTLATGLGVLVGRWASRRALRPLTAVTAAAGAIAEGDLDARLGRRNDPDLDPIAQAFDSTAARLQARVERDARFAADVSHELRSPLTTMVNAVEVLLARQAEMGPETREVLQLLSDDVHRFAEMVKDLLELALMDGGSVPDARQEVGVTDLVRNVADRLAGRPVTHARGGVDPVLTIDPRRLERIVENLVRNAETHGRGVTDVLVEQEGDVVRIVVADCGPGVPGPDQERVFDRFARGGGGSSDHSGVGLGLAIVAEHVRAHQGRIRVTDGPGGGAQFVVELPGAHA